MENGLEQVNWRLSACAQAARQKSGIHCYPLKEGMFHEGGEEGRQQSRLLLMLSVSEVSHK